MSYTRPSPSSVPFWVGTDFTRPSPSAVEFTYEASGLIFVPLAIQAVEVVATSVPAGLISLPIANGEPALVGGVGANAWVAVEDPLSSPTLEARALWSDITVPSALSAPEVVGSSLLSNDFTVGAPVYSRPSPSAVDFDYEPFGRLSVPGPFGAPEILADVGPIGVVSVPMPNDPAVFSAVGAAGRVSVEISLSSPALEARALWAAISAPIACGAPAVWGTSSFDGLIPSTAQLAYLLDIITPSGAVRVPMSSWQSSLQTDAQSYVQAVIPNVEPWLATLDAGTEFVIYKRARWSTYEVFSEMARAPLQTVRTDRGSTNYTGTIQGYGPAFPEIDSQSSAFTRALQDVRTVSSFDGGTRMRAGIDWTLRPGMTASYAAISFTVSYVNHYVTSGDEYMDVGGDL